MFDTAIRTSAVFLCVAMALTLAAPVSQAQAQERCRALPSVQWWNDIDHKRMIAYVEARHGGDWDAYIAKWQGHLSSVQAIYDRDGAVFSKKLGRRLTGRGLGEYIAAVERRLSITRCLANREMARAAKTLEGLETASGAEEPLPETVR